MEESEWTESPIPDAFCDADWLDGMDIPSLPESFSAPPTRDSPIEELNAPGSIPDADDVPTRVRTRLRGTAFFLTYSQSKLGRDAVTKFFGKQAQVKRCIVGMEHHQDGNTHWHCLIEYVKMKDVRNMRYFDIGDEHPNIKWWSPAGGSTYEQWLVNHWKYCQKEDPTPFTMGEAPAVKSGKKDAKFTQAMEIARREGVDQAVTLLEQIAPYDLLTKYDQLTRALYAYRNKYCKSVNPARAVCDFKFAPKIVDDWRNLFINGPTGLGKTQWARSLLPEAPIIRHGDSLRGVDFSKGIIFDDFDVSHWPATPVIHLLDWEEPSGINVKHGSVMIPAGTRKIFTHNCSFERWVPTAATEEQIAAMRRRIHVINIHTKLF